MLVVGEDRLVSILVRRARNIRPIECPLVSFCVTRLHLYPLIYNTCAVNLTTVSSEDLDSDIKTHKLTPKITETP